MSHASAVDFAERTIDFRFVLIIVDTIAKTFMSLTFQVYAAASPSFGAFIASI